MTNTLVGIFVGAMLTFAIMQTGPLESKTFVILTDTKTGVLTGYVLLNGDLTLDEAQAEMFRSDKITSPNSHVAVVWPARGVFGMFRSR